MYTTTATRVLEKFRLHALRMELRQSRSWRPTAISRNRVLNQAKLYGLASTIETGSLNVDDGAVPKLQIPGPRKWTTWSCASRPSRAVGHHAIDVHVTG